MESPSSTPPASSPQLESLPLQDDLKYWPKSSLSPVGSLGGGHRVGPAPSLQDEISTSPPVLDPGNPGVQL